MQKALFCRWILILKEKSFKLLEDCAKQVQNTLKSFLTSTKTSYSRVFLLNFITKLNLHDEDEGSFTWLDYATNFILEQKNSQVSITFLSSTLQYIFMMAPTRQTIKLTSVAVSYSAIIWERLEMFHRFLIQGNTKQSLGTLFTRTNYITLKYVTDSWGNDNSFKLIITAIKDGSKEMG